MLSINIWFILGTPLIDIDSITFLLLHFSSYGMWEVIQDLLLWMQAVKAPRPNVSPADMSQTIQDVIDRVTHEPLAVGTV